METDRGGGCAGGSDGAAGDLADGVEADQGTLGAVSQLPAIDPIPQVVPVILGEHHQHRKRVGELVTLVKG